MLKQVKERKKSGKKITVSENVRNFGVKLTIFI